MLSEDKEEVAVGGCLLEVLCQTCFPTLYVGEYAVESLKDLEGGGVIRGATGKKEVVLVLQRASVKSSLDVDPVDS